MLPINTVPLINPSNVSEAARYMLDLGPDAIEKKFQHESPVLFASLNAALKTYNETEISYIKGESLINIIDHYMKSLIEASKAVYDILNEDAKRQLEILLYHEN